MGTLKSQNTALRSRLDGQPPSVAARRARATLAGTGQALVDVDIQIRQVGPQVERAIKAGGDQAGKALEEESTRVNGYLQALAVNVTAASKELDEIGRTEPARSEQAE